MFALENNGPSIAAEMRATADQTRLTNARAKFVVVSLAYDRKGSRHFAASTAKQAFRVLASVCDGTRGKLYRKGEFAACVVTPDNHVMNWSELKAAIKQGSI